ncbi:hypothetical protein N7466_002414 [Penicillium verhagenii]|uniref:uncharacterized protein n=1 Tax=Penicillium verhagenii TaxID=1562060 RepID=UPI002545088D|nr:uncharacterized protein N7466_002414 [Penicillium verhagenii]KAJ5939280.1 hypothetical protein N7466_002414 [Penicillium verhagenii]
MSSNPHQVTAREFVRLVILYESKQASELGYSTSSETTSSGRTKISGGDWQPLLLQNPVAERGARNWSFRGPREVEERRRVLAKGISRRNESRHHAEHFEGTWSAHTSELDDARTKH